MLDWSSSAINRSAAKQADKSDFVMLEVEGGAAFDWGGLYGFIDLENPLAGVPDAGHTSEGTRVAAKGVVDVNLWSTPVAWYTHIFSISDNANAFEEQNLVFEDLLCDSNRERFLYETFCRCALGPEYRYVRLYGMLGWVMNYDFSVASASFSLTNWTEIEFARAKDYTGYEVNGEWIATNGGSYGGMGALGLFWNATAHFSTGIQWSYAYQKLGDDFMNNSMIYTMKYKF